MDESFKEIILTIQYFWMVFCSTWKTILGWTKITKVAFGLMVVLLIFDCLILLGLANILPVQVTPLINDLGSEIRIDLTKVAFAILFFTIIFPFLFLREATKIYHNQEKIITERVPGQLALNIERIPTNIISVDGKDFKASGLLVKSLEKKKIIELQALINFDHFDYGVEIKHVSHVSYDYNSRLLWSGEKLGEGEKEIELRPEIPKILLICELTKTKTNDGQDIDIALISSDPTPIGMNFSRESIFQIRIKFQGKLEGEYDFRTFHYKETLYTKPSDQRILFLDDAERTYSDISKDLLNSAKGVLQILR